MNVVKNSTNPQLDDFGNSDNNSQEVKKILDNLDKYEKILKE